MNLAELSAVVSDEAKAFEMVERLRWPNSPVCPHCGATDRIYVLEGVKDKRGRVRHGLKKCGHCRRQFTVRVGSIFEDSPIPLGKWLLAIHLMCSSKKGISSHQIMRELGISYQSAWFLTHRIRLAMTVDPLKSLLGGDGGVVEADETFVGGKARNRAYRKPAPKKAVVALVERQGRVRSHHVADVTADDLKPILRGEIDKASHLRTDESGVYWTVGEEFASHRTVNHSAKEYVCGDAYTNTVEGYFSILKRGIYGVYQHVSARHLHRYLAEFDFRYSYRIKLGYDDTARTVLAIKGAAGKRLTYRPLIRRAPRVG